MPDERNQHSKEARVFFSEEKKQKTFNFRKRSHRYSGAKEQKFFGSFFQKRTFLPFFLNQGEAQ
jgi:hypothetical protein